MKRIVMFSVVATLLSGAAPSAAQQEEAPNYLLDDCIKVCNTIASQEIKSCDELFDMENEFSEHLKCISEAQEKHDDCIKVCHENYDR